MGFRNGCAALDDTEMYYVSFGSGKKNLVVLPGLSEGLMTVKGKALALSLPYRKFLKEYTVYMFGRKMRMPEGYSIRDMAEDLARVMRPLGIEKACVLGVSEGGMIAQYFAADHPEMTEKLILAVTAPYANDNVQDAVKTWIGMAERGDHTALMTDTARRTYSERYLTKNGKFIPLVAKLTKPSDYGRFLRNADAILAFDAREEVPKISCPTLILAGEKDRTIGHEAPYELHRMIDGSELYIYPGLGHGAFEEGKDFYDRVLAFCRKG